MLAIGFELVVPRASQNLIDAAVKGPANVHGAWRAWAFFVAIYIAFSVIRNVAIRPWIPLAARTMEEMTNEAFKQVQSFSADWHADNFAGATVRQLTRAMWGYDMVADAVVIWIGPALIVLVGLSLQMMLRWPLGYFTLRS